MKTENSFKAGMYLLETLTSGMYNDPLSIYREYIQNSVDSIDICSSKTNKSVNITLDPFTKSITIFDNGSGIPIKNATSILSGIGSSNKAGTDLRGFRGIGRLGGIAFSDTVSFRTKAVNDNAEVIQKWDCIKLRKLLANPKNSSMHLDELFNEITTFEKNKSNDINKSFFEVKLEGVSSFRNYLFDIKKVREYIAKTCPVDYSPDTFQYGKQISKYLKTNVNDYNSYPIYLNDKQIFKPYNNHVKVTSKGFDIIESIDFITIQDYEDIFAYGWIGKRKDLLGSISKGDDSSGIQVRAGNILLGDSHLLDRCFREERFNSYVVGELHIAHPELIPNSRRDDFIDNDYKSRFYDAIEKQIGLPMSKEIRDKSKQKSFAKESFQNALHQEDNERLLEPQRELIDLKKNKTNIQDNENNTYSLLKDKNDILIKSILKNCTECSHFKNIHNDIFNNN